MSQFKTYIRIALIILCIVLFLLSCRSAKISRTHTVTDTIIKFDTTIIYKNDTVPLIKEVRITDTAIVENSSGIARSYFSVSKQRIVLELQGKPIAVPVSIYKYVHTEADDKNKEVKRSSFWFEFAVGVIIVSFVMYLFQHEPKK